MTGAPLLGLAKYIYYKSEMNMTEELLKYVFKECHIFS